MPEIKPYTAAEFEEWLDGAFKGDPQGAREYCERTMSPNYIRFQANGDRTDFERAVEKVTLFRGICRKWEAKAHLLVQEGNKIAVRMTTEFILGDTPENKMELMFMAERDEQGRFEKVWELVMPLAAD